MSSMGSARVCEARGYVKRAGRSAREVRGAQRVPPRVERAHADGPHSKIDIVYLDIGGQPIVLSI